MPLTVRAARAADLDAVVAVFLGCWRESYAAVLPARLVEGMTDERARALWTRVLTGGAGDVLVVESREASGNVVLAVARIGVGERGEGMVHSLYVSPRAQGTGVGSRLLAAASDALRSAGSMTAHLWVFRDNAPSVAFYRHHGWYPDGRTRVQDEFGEPEIRLATLLAGDPATGVLS